MTLAAGRDTGLNLSFTSKPSEYDDLGNAKKSGVSKKAVEHFNILRDGLFLSAHVGLPPFQVKSIGCLM